MKILFIKVKILVDISSYIDPPIILTIEPRMVDIFWACGLIFFSHMSFWWLLSHLLTTHHSNMVAQLEKVTIKRPAYIIFTEQLATFNVRMYFW